MFSFRVIQVSYIQVIVWHLSLETVFFLPPITHFPQMDLRHVHTHGYT